MIEDHQVSDFGRSEQQRLARMEGLIPKEVPFASESEILVVRGDAEEIPRVAWKRKQT